jgi:putative SOS response-associated peptidase YedK
MCGRFNLRTPMTVLAQQFLFDLGPLAKEAFRPRYNIAPTQLVAAVRRLSDKNQRQLAVFHWGLIPSWAKDKKIAYSTINARGDSVADKPVFRAAFKSRRCLVLADGYYEWLTEGKKKLPLHYHMQGGKPFAFAGLWETWHGPPPHDGPPLESCTIITTSGNELAAKVHDRMPVILHERDYDLWLDPTVSDKERLKALLVPYPAEEMTADRVSMRVNNVKNEGPECLAAAEEE